MKAVFRPTLLVILAIVLFGCMSFRPGYEVLISGFGRPDFNNASQRYLLFPGDRNVRLNDLQFEEYSKYVDYALARRGHLKADSIDDATEVIFLYYGIGNPQEHQYTFSLPTSGEIGVSSSTTTDTFNTYGIWGSYGGPTTYTSNVTYFRFVSLSAVDITKWNANQQVIELWRMEIFSTGSSFDLRSVFPVMIAASKEYLGKNTGKAITLTLRDEDPEVVDIRAVSTP